MAEIHHGVGFDGHTVVHTGTKRYTPDGRVIPTGGSGTAPPRTAHCESPATAGSILPHQVEHLAAEVARLTAREAELQSLLRECEQHCPVCPLCGRDTTRDAHSVTCRLHAALRGPA